MKQKGKIQLATLPQDVDQQSCDVITALNEQLVEVSFVRKSEPWSDA